jgi:hypothetical protein
MKTISKQAIRSKAVGTVLASLRIERLKPSDAVVQAMQACMSGRETTVNVIQQVKQRHDALRRV